METAAHDLDLSRRRAEAVHAPLARLLGAGWNFDVQGFGETGRSPRTRRTTGRRTPRGARNPRVEIAGLS
jgi:outer membrane protein OmpA-like peptidoglycan-associated protein